MIAYTLACDGNGVGGVDGASGWGVSIKEKGDEDRIVAEMRRMTAQEHIALQDVLYKAWGPKQPPDRPMCRAATEWISKVPKVSSRI